jgi:hypothetical protein
MDLPFEFMQRPYFNTGSCHRGVPVVDVMSTTWAAPESPGARREEVAETRNVCPDGQS